MKSIVWTSNAAGDLENIHEYIAVHSPDNASQFIAKLVRSVQHLASLPKSGRAVPESSEANIREVLFQDYRLIYREEKEQVLILTVIHGSRDISKVAPKFKTILH